jgi:hypothetical protein
MVGLQDDYWADTWELPFFVEFWPADDIKMKCKFCNEETKLIKAHIVPAGFFKKMRDGTPLQLISKSPGIFPRRLPIGVYDKTILCSMCDGLLGRYDQYAQEAFLGNSIVPEPLRNHEGIQALCYKGIDYALLKLFFLATLWRAAVSSSDFFSRVHLGPFEASIREMLRAGEPGEANDFGVFITQIDSIRPVAVMDPAPHRFDGVNYYKLYLERLHVFVKVDSRPGPDVFQKFYIKPGKPVWVMLMDDYHDSEQSSLKRMIKNRRRLIRRPER